MPSNTEDSPRSGRQSVDSEWFAMTKTYRMLGSKWATSTSLTFLSIELYNIGPSVIEVGLAFQTKSGQDLGPRESYRIVVESTQHLRDTREPFSFGAQQEITVANEQDLIDGLNALVAKYESQGHEICLTSFAPRDSIDKLRTEHGWNAQSAWTVIGSQDMWRKWAMMWKPPTYQKALEDFGIEMNGVSLSNPANVAWLSLELLVRQAEQVGKFVPSRMKRLRQPDDDADADDVMSGYTAVQDERSKSEEVDRSSKRAKTAELEDGGSSEPVTEMMSLAELEDGGSSEPVTETMSPAEPEDGGSSEPVTETMSPTEDSLAKHIDALEAAAWYARILPQHRLVDIEIDNMSKRICLRIMAECEEMRKQGIACLEETLVRVQSATMESKELALAWADNRMEALREEVQAKRYGALAWIGGFAGRSQALLCRTGANGGRMAKEDRVKIETELLELQQEVMAIQ